MTQESLSEQQERFVTEFVRTGNASAAARLSGFGARSGASLLETPAIKTEIERRQSEKAAEPASEGDIHALVAEADEAIRIAKEANNATGIVAAIQLKARLLGILEGNELAPEPAPAQTATREEMLTALLQFLQATGAMGAIRNSEGGGGGGDLLSNGAPSDTPSENIELLPDGIVSITDPEQIKRWDAERAALDTSTIPANIKTFSTGFYWRKRYDEIIKRDVFDLYDAAGSHCGTRQSRERADRWCEQEGVV